ncbi:unnamed protein product [Rotaria sordida]|uniref:Uncharacterized protein n=1 Tax=Rotaria sordida TaxID=392033 RepID=A0A815T8D0_9BILA|nr:unnamed protein product [Rotaria sordida]
MNSCIPSGNLAKKDCCDDEDGNLSVTSYISTINFYNVSKSVAYGLQSHKNSSSTEIILVIWVITLVCEELRQVHDLKFFMLMSFVFILAFGVSFYSLVFGVQEFTWHLSQLSLDDKSITKTETTEDAYGAEVYYNYLKQERKLLDEPDLDEERV